MPNSVQDDDLLTICDAVATAVGSALGGVADWSRPGKRRGQYALDLAADDAALSILHGAGIGVLSEESGRTNADADLTAVLDPVDGSTNAARGIPWFACSIAIVDGDGPRVALVANLASGERHWAVRGQGAWSEKPSDGEEGRPVAPSECTSLNAAVIALSGYPREHLGWSQFRCFGAAALDLCCVADGRLDGYLVTGGSTIGVWDYLGGLLVCREAGAVVSEIGDGELMSLDHGARHRIAAAATPEVLDALVEAAPRASAPSGG